MKSICLVIILLFSSIVMNSCMPGGSSKEKNKVESTQKKQTDTKKTITSKSKNEKENTTEKIEQKLYDENVKRLSELAVAKKSIKKNSAKNNSNNSPFAKTEEKLKNISNESERFIDTSYYMLKMENDVTEEMTNVVFAEERNVKYFDELIRTFDIDVGKYENTRMYDCNNFLIYSNQFTFSDSLKQLAIYHYANCCANYDLLDESVNTLEELVKNKMNRNIAPLALSKLGQIYCLQGEKKKAEKIFKRLKKEYPRSSLIQSADCHRM